VSVGDLDDFFGKDLTANDRKEVDVWGGRVKVSNKIFLLMVLMLSCVGCDQATKRLAQFALKDNRPLSFLSNTFRLEYAENKGAFLSMGATLSDDHRFLVLILFSSFLLVAMAIYVCMSRKVRALEITGYGLIIAGGLSNMIDRIFAGAVVDFMNIGIGNLRTGIFNVADVAIMAGLFVVIYAQSRAAREEPVVRIKSDAAPG
jgi:signal peptidase II